VSTRIKAKQLDPESATINQVPVADGLGAVSWQTQAGTVVEIDDTDSPYPVTTATTVLCDAVAAAIIVGLPAAAGKLGVVIHVKKVDSSANTVTIDGNAAETIDGVLTQVLRRQWASLQLQSNGTNWYIL
jgi:hypothetical protein